MTGPELKKKREQMGLSQRELAEALSLLAGADFNFDVGTISRWERGASKVPPFLDLALAALRCR
jgi:transcriptional regulator with XRE-family HTH domain